MPFQLAVLLIKAPILIVFLSYILENTIYGDLELLHTKLNKK